MGNIGTGKTHVTVDPGIAACGQGRNICFFPVTEPITQHMEVREVRDLLRLTTTARHDVAG